MKVLVTGANGLLGHHVVMELLNRTEQVKIIIRSTQNIYFDLNKVEFVIGNFYDETILNQAAKDCDAIIHIAAVTSTDLLNYRQYKKINVDGSKSVIKAAENHHIHKIVFVSTSNTIGYGCSSHSADEKWLFEYPFTESFYAKSKFKAEKLFTNYAKDKKDKDNHVIIINPAFMIGSHDVKPSSGKLILMAYRKKTMPVPSGGKSFVPVKDVAVACCNALTRGISGERYLASGVNMSFRDFYEMQSRIADYKQKIVEVPDFLLLVAGYVGDFLRMLGLRISLSTRNINQLLIREYYSNEKAKRDLDMPETSIEHALKNAIEWFELNKKV